MLNCLTKQLIAVLLIISLLGGSALEAQQEVGFVEKFALAKDRREVLSELIPGTNDYYYFHCLHYQNSGQLAQAQAILDQWAAKHGKNQQVNNMVSRQYLLTYDENPEKTLDYLKRTLGLNFDHAPPQKDEAASLPTKLDNAKISTERLLAWAVASDQSLRQIDDAGLARLVAAKLSVNQSRALIARLRRTDVKGVVQLLAGELGLKDSRGFGWASCHSLLTLAQLDELQKLRPELIENDKFVRAYAARLAPAEGVSLVDKAELRKYLDRLLSFAERLPVSQNSFKALVLGNLLRLDLNEGVFSRERFLAYLALPRNASYYDLRRFRNQRVSLAALNYSMQPQVPLPPMRDDSELVQRFLEHFFVSEDRVDAFARYLNRGYLDRILAETKILNGLGDPATWYGKLSPAFQKQLRDRIEIRFAPHNATLFASNDAVKLDVEVKNVDELVVKVFEINTAAYLRNNAQPLGTDIDLDGLVANSQRKLSYSQPSDRRHVETLEFPELDGRGVWVIDLLGGGQRSRALIKKGDLVAVERLGDAGQVLHIYDENGKPAKSAHIELGGRVYASEGDDARIVLPFAEKTVNRKLLLVDGDFAVQESVTHYSENYDLRAAFLLSRQSLVAGTKAAVTINTQLSCNGIPVSNQLLEKPVLTIKATDVDGITTTQTVNKSELSDEVDLVHSFLVPQRLRQIEFRLSAKVLNQSREIRETVEASKTISCNGIANTNQIGDFFLQPLRGEKEGVPEFRLTVLGRNGEPIPRLPVSIAIKHRLMESKRSFSLATDANGQIDLGPLTDIASFEANAQGLQSLSFSPNAFERAWPKTLHVAANESLGLPLGTSSADASEFSLFEVRRGLNYTNLNEKLTVESGALTFAGLTPGNYVLTDHERSQNVQIVVEEGATEANYIIGDYRMLQTRRVSPLLIRDVRIQDGVLRAKIEGADSAARVHLVANVFDAPSLGRELRPNSGLLSKSRRIVESSFVNSLRLDEEYTYILNRQGLPKYPGNMLPHPTLLIQPWEVSVTENLNREAQRGDALPPSTEADAMRSMLQGNAEDGLRRQEQANWKSYDFLSGGTAVIANLEIENGEIAVPLADLQGYAAINILAVHPLAADSRSIAIGEGATPTRDQRLIEAFPENASLAQKQTVEFLRAGETKSIGDPKTRRIKTFSQLSDVFQLYSTLLDDSDWEKFRFLANWPALSREEQLSRYNEMACHEVNFFLFHKDPEFFKEIVEPLLSQKQNKQLLDRWLVGDSIAEYAELWRLQRLNTLERILLAQQLDPARAGTQRWLRDIVEAHPIPPQLRQQRFEVALRGDALSTDMFFSAGVVMDSEESLMEMESMSAFAGGGFGASGRPMRPRTSNLARGRQAPEPAAAPEAADYRFKKKGGRSAGGGLGMERQLGRGFNSPGFFQSLDQTKEWAETNYYRVLLKSQAPTLINPSPFWKQFLEADCEPFLPSDLDLPVENVNEALCALAVIDLPFDEEETDVSIVDDQLVISTAGPSIVFLESIETSKKSDKQQNILVGQDIYLANSGSDEKLNLPIANSNLLRGVPYRAKVVVTNPSNVQQQVQVLTQLPAGSLPLGGHKSTDSSSIELAPYTTSQVEYEFYFPKEGEFEHYGAQINGPDGTIASTPAAKLEVRAAPVSVDESSWSYIADWGTNAQVLDYLNKANWEQLDLSRVAFRLADREFYDSLMPILAESGRYEPTLWAYSVRHNDVEGMEQLLQNRDDFVSKLGEVLQSSLIEIDPQEQFSFEHLEYKPLVVARTHQLGPKPTILNPSLNTQYHRLLHVLAHQATISDSQRLQLCYYMLLQNRIGESLELFEEIDSGEVSAELQYAYFDAYLDLYRGDYQRAARIAQAYSEYPVPRWKELFSRIVEQVAEREALLSGREPTEFVSREERDESQRILADERSKRNERLADKSPALSLEIQGNQLAVDTQNVDEIEVAYYLMDIELLFSRNPFVSQGDGQSPVIQPNFSEKLELGNKGSRLIDIPVELQNRNLLVEVSGAGLSRSRVITANALNVTVVESFGQLSVMSAQGNGPVEGAYVKVYARHSGGQVKFFKDGYTDLRGKFDYATLSTSDLNTAERFSILVLHPKLGASVQEAAPPTR